MHNLIEKVHKKLDERNKDEIMNSLEEMEKAILTDGELVVEITNPATYSGLQKRITEEFNVPHKAMMLKARVISRKRRAYMFIKALENGVKRIE